MDDDELLEKIKALKLSTGKGELTIADIALLQPGLARIMPEVGTRTWKLFYAAQAGNWPLAKFQYKEIAGLMEMGATTRPKHAEALHQYLVENWKPLGDAIDRKDFAEVEAAFHAAVDAANHYHELKGKAYLIWKLPDTPPPDLDLTPRKKT